MSSSNFTNTSGSIGSKSSRFSTLKVFKFGSSKEPKSKDGARPLRGGAAAAKGVLWSARDLRVRV